MGFMAFTIFMVELVDLAMGTGGKAMAKASLVAGQVATQKIKW